MSSNELLNRMEEILEMLYPEEDVNKILDDIKTIIERYKKSETILEKRKKYEDQIVLNEDDVLLITYADSIHKQGEKPLQTLHRSLINYVKSAVTCVHILPFFPSSSDGGFSVIDYKKVDPVLGTWEDIQNITRDYRLMADLVMNHVSSRSGWFQGFLNGEDRYRDYFLSYDQPVDMPKVFRPRVHPLLTAFDTALGKKYVWTTFSEDQIDLNFHNPQVTLEILEVFMFYLSKGIEIIRLDAIGYVWKEPETSCVNLPQTHEMVKLLRTVAEYMAPYAIIVTEVNFPYKDNVSYLEARHEANMAYHFSLPPLVIDSFIQKDTSYLQKETERIRQDLLFLNYLASHDGIGVSGAKEILPRSRFERLLEVTTEHGGVISYKATQEGKVPYELNITYYDAVNDPSHPDPEADVKRFMAAASIMLTDKGVPGIYIHCLLGSRNYLEGVKETGINRMINREKLSAEEVYKDLSNPESLRYQVLEKFLYLLKVRKEIQAFHHSVERTVLQSDERLFIIERIYKEESVLAVVNVSDDTIKLAQYKGKYDLISKVLFEGWVAPYGVYFLK
ncbi:MAG: sugar phosphorylase [Desulfobacteraceae bacterium]|nr:sugar phosphorylase [Desulfobacteraceae bacterium]